MVDLPDPVSGPAPVPPPQPDPYPAIFRIQILRSIRYVLDQLHATAAPIPSQEIQELALHVLDYGLSLAADQPEAWDLSAPTLTILAPGMEQAGHRADWADYLRRGLAVAQAKDDRASAAPLYFYLGTLYQLQGDLPEARSHFVAAGADYGALNQDRDRARAINREAYVARLMQRNQESDRLVDQALALLGETDPERGYSYFVRGCNAFDARAWGLAETWYRRSLETWYREEDPRMVAWNLTNLGTALRRLDRMDEAAHCYRQAIEIFDEIQDPAHRAVAQMNLGTIHLLADDLDAALAAYLAAEDSFRRLNDDVHLAQIYTNLGLLYARQRRTVQAETAYVTAIAGYEKLGSVAAMVNAMDSLGELYRDTGRLDLARSTWQQAQDRLAAIADTPAYAYYFNMVSNHLAELE